MNCRAELMHAHLAWHHYMSKGFDDALAQAQRVVGMEPSFHWGHFFAGWSLERLGQHDEAVTHLQKAVQCSSNNPVMLAGLGHVLASSRDRRAALRIVDELRKLRGRKGLFAYEIAVIHSSLDDLDVAFEWFTRAVQERSGWVAYLRVDPRLDRIHKDSRFEHLVSQRSTG
jgi:tetratricopeptide (TPR) repeat protein